MAKRVYFENKPTGFESESMRIYRNQVRRIPLIDAEREVVLSEMVKRGGKEKRKAVEELTLGNLRFAISMAKHYMGSGLAFDDLVQEANMGLIKAAEDYDDAKAAHFPSFAVGYIRDALMKAVREKGYLYTIPQKKFQKVAEMNQQFSIFAASNETLSKDEYLYGKDDDDARETMTVMEITQKHMPLDATVSEDGDMTFADMLTDGQHADMHLNRRDSRRRLKAILQLILGQRNAEIIWDSFGFNEGVEMTEGMMEEKYNLTATNLSTIRNRALNAIRKSRHLNEIESLLRK